MSTDQDGTSFFTNAHERVFGEASPQDDRLHREAMDEIDHPELVETQFLGFNVPDQALQAFNYVWAHPNVGTVSGGTWSWRGVNPSQLHSELFDMRNYMPLSAVGLDGLGVGDERSTRNA